MTSSKENSYTDLLLPKASEATTIGYSPFDFPEMFASYASAQPTIDPSVLDAYPPALSHIINGTEFGPMLCSPDVVNHRNSWRQFFNDLIRQPPCSQELSEHFHTQWHVCHHFVRQLVADDELLMDMLWIWLPRYQGDSMTLYRGENINRYEERAIGTAWTDKLDVAEMFASGLNAVGKGGIVLRSTVTSSAIVAGPTGHSRDWLGENEFTVDVRKLDQLEVLTTFPPA